MVDDEVGCFCRFIIFLFMFCGVFVGYVMIGDYFNILYGGGVVFFYKFL